MVGYEPESRSSSSDANALKTMVTLLQQQNSNQQAEINLLSQTVRLLTQLVAKDYECNTKRQELNKIQDEAYNKERNQKGLLNNVSFS